MVERKIVDLPTNELIDQLELIAEINMRCVFKEGKELKQLKSDAEMSTKNCERVLIIWEELKKRIENKTI